MTVAQYSTLFKSTYHQIVGVQCVPQGSDVLITQDTMAKTKGPQGFDTTQHFRLHSLYCTKRLVLRALWRQ